MSTFDKKTLGTLEFNKIIQQLLNYASSTTAKEQISLLKPSNDREKIEAALNETADGVRLIKEKGGIPIASFTDLTAHLKRLSIGASLNGEEVSQVGRLLKNVREVKIFFSKIKEESDIPLDEIAVVGQVLNPLPQLLEVMEYSIDDSGGILDSASTSLRKIRSSISANQNDIRRILNGMIKGKYAKYLTDNLITMRNDRFVLPVKAESKKAVGGVVHDQSSSGQTLYIEPQAVVDKNNHLRQLAVEEKQEEDRILAELSEKIASHATDIQKNQALMTHLDVVNAKARYAVDMNAVHPAISLDHVVDLKQARHPLLDPAEVVPNDIILGQDYKTIIVTGPNTGGKTIVLKTLGLLQMMAQAGLHIPAQEKSQIAIFDGIYADIGDEQSIEQSLSTFSSHMTNINHILQRMTSSSLVLIDELGSGTDPQEGAALAIAILEYIRQVGPLAMISSHYPELKSYGYQQEETINASMTFDVDSLSPTFELQIGVPGRSNAFEISKRLGVDQDIIDRAKSLMTADSQSVDDMISDLDHQRRRAEEEYEDFHQQYIEAFKVRRQLEDAYQQLNQEREQLMEEAQEKAATYLDDAKTKADRIISDIRQKQMDLGQATVKEHELIDAQSQLDRLRSQEEKDQLAKNKHIKKAKKEQGLQVGDEVQVLPFNQNGTLIEALGKDEWMVQMGSMKMKVQSDQMELTKKNSSSATSPVSSHRASRPRVGTELDIRGERFEKGMDELAQYLDAALLNHYESVTIIHGHGTGALRQGTHQLLKKHPQVEDFELAPANQGGTGATLVKLKSSR